MRSGRFTGVCDPRDETEASLSRLMIGSEPPAIVHRDQPAGEVRLSVRKLALPKAHPFATELIDVDFELRAGEILGVAGVSGNGQPELLGEIGRAAWRERVCQYV